MLIFLEPAIGGYVVDSRQSKSIDCTIRTKCSQILRCVAKVDYSNNDDYFTKMLRYCSRNIIYLTYYK
jgi:hypothetical protein